MKLQHIRDSSTRLQHGFLVKELLLGLGSLGLLFMLGVTARLTLPCLMRPRLFSTAIHCLIWLIQFRCVCLYFHVYLYCSSKQHVFLYGELSLLHYSPLLKKACVGQVVLDKWFPPRPE